MRFSSLENIASKLAELEKAWSVLGPNRKIVFNYRFGDLKLAETFASAVEEKGCQSWISSCDSQRYVGISMIMEPLAVNVIYWQELLDSLADLRGIQDDSGDWCYSEGWCYPGKEDILFSPPSSFKRMFPRFGEHGPGVTG